MGKKNLKVLLFAIMFLMATAAEYYPAMPGQADMVAAATVVKPDKRSVRIIKGQTAKVKLKGAAGKITWKSKNKSIASVKKNGVITARKKGKTTVYADYKGKSYQCTVYVETPKLSKKSVSLEIGKTEQLKVSGTKQKVAWSTKQPKIATVNADGTVTAKAEGTTVITAKVGKKKYRCNITVTKSSQSTSNAPEEPNAEDAKLPDYELKLQGSSIIPMSQEKVRITLKNNTANDIDITTYYHLDIKRNGEWVAYDLGYSFLDVMVEFKAGETEEYSFRLGYGEGELIPGEYRFTKKVGEEALSVEFTVQTDKNEEIGSV